MGGTAGAEKDDPLADMAVTEKKGHRTFQFFDLIDVHELPPWRCVAILNGLARFGNRKAPVRCLCVVDKCCGAGTITASLAESGHEFFQGADRW
ncbi:hypothetical protein JCM30471_23610 [Desulfuromonas carbonis]